MVPTRWDTETAGGPSEQAGMDERLAQFAISRAKGPCALFCKTRGRNQLDDFPEPFLNHIATCALVSNQAVFLVVAVVDGLADRRRLNESRPLLRRYPGRPENGLVDRFRLPELFLRRVEPGCDKVVAIPKGPVDELLPVFGNDGLLSFSCCIWEPNIECFQMQCRLWRAGMPT